MVFGCLVRLAETVRLCTKYPQPRKLPRDLPWKINMLNPTMEVWKIIFLHSIGWNSWVPFVNFQGSLQKSATSIWLLSISEDGLVMCRRWPTGGPTGIAGGTVRWEMRFPTFHWKWDIKTHKKNIMRKKQTTFNVKKWKKDAHLFVYLYIIFIISTSSSKPPDMKSTSLGRSQRSKQHSHRPPSQWSDRRDSTYGKRWDLTLKFEGERQDASDWTKKNILRKET